MIELREQSTLPVDAPSPLVGESCAAGQRILAWVRDPLSAIPMRRQLLTRLRFAKPPSPAKGEGASTAVRSCALP